MKGRDLSDPCLAKELAKQWADCPTCLNSTRIKDDKYLNLQGGATKDET